LILLINNSDGNDDHNASHSTWLWLPLIIRRVTKWGEWFCGMKI